MATTRRLATAERHPRLSSQGYIDRGHADGHVFKYLILRSCDPLGSALLVGDGRHRIGIGCCLRIPLDDGSANETATALQKILQNLMFTLSAPKRCRILHLPVRILTLKNFGPTTLWFLRRTFHQSRRSRPAESRRPDSAQFGSGAVSRLGVRSGTMLFRFAHLNDGAGSPKLSIPLVVVGQLAAVLQEAQRLQGLGCVALDIGRCHKNVKLCPSVERGLKKLRQTTPGERDVVLVLGQRACASMEVEEALVDVDRLQQSHVGFHSSRLRNLLGSAEIRQNQCGPRLRPAVNLAQVDDQQGVRSTGS
eukprot:scaffold7392_cov286-Pinguiococcus_pyrenoidosus.AAC.12